MVLKNTRTTSILARTVNFLERSDGFFTAREIAEILQKEGYKASQINVLVALSRIRREEPSLIEAQGSPRKQKYRHRMFKEQG